MFSKVVALFGLVAVATAADLSVGREGGQLIFDKNVTASPAIWKQVQNLTVNATDDALISRIVVIDNRPEKDGEAKVVDGGEGHNNVTIELKSPTVFRGFDFTVKVFASEGSVQVPQHPVIVGAGTQVPVTKDVRKPQEPKNDGDIMIGGTAPTPSTTGAPKDGQVKVNPAVAGQEQTRLNRDTQDQKPKDSKDQTTISTPTEPAVLATKDKEHHNPAVLKDMDPSLKHALDAIFTNNASQKSDDTQKVEVLPILPASEKDGQVPQVLKDNQVTTPKAEASSTTLKNVEQKLVPSTVSTSTDVPTTKLTTESSNLPQSVQTTHGLEKNIKGHHGHAVPLPYHH